MRLDFRSGSFEETIAILSATGCRGIQLDPFPEDPVDVAKKAFALIRPFLDWAGHGRSRSPVTWERGRSMATVVLIVALVLLFLPFLLFKKCRTLHHEDCWRYARRCATYGCGGRRAVRA